MADITETKTEELFLSISGMSCVNCSRGIEKALNKAPGVSSARVFLADESAEVIFIPEEISASEILKKISELGYEARILGAPKEEENPIPALVFTAVLAIPVFYFSMFAVDPSSWPNRFSQMVLSGIILMTTGKRFFIGGVRSLKNYSFNMDLLVSLGVGVSWTYSTAVMIFPSLSHHGMVHFETAAVLVLFILFGKSLESAARSKATESLKSLTSLQNGTVRRKVNPSTGKEKSEFETVELSKVAIDDKIKILPGERFLVDGIVESGESSADESLLTGEPLPIEKKSGSTVISGSLNITGELIVTVKKNVSDSTLQGIIRAVRMAQADKPEIQRFADKASEYFVPGVIGISLLTFIGWMTGGFPVQIALMHAVTVLVVACPCALGLATPMAIVVASGIAMRRGVLVKKTSALEGMADLKFILMDKTGTLTEGKPSVRRMDVFGDTDRKKIISMAFALASRSIHPLSKAVANHLQDAEKIDLPLKNFEEKKGFGLSADDSDGKKWLMGSGLMMEENAVTIPELSAIFQAESLSPVYLSDGEKPMAVFGLSDNPRPEAKAAIEALKSQGIEVVMVSGDKAAPARAIAKSIGIEEVRAETLPRGKLDIVREFLARGNTGFVGDGINDVPALSAATVGLAMGSGTDAAKEATDLVLIGKDLGLLSFCVNLSRATFRKIRQNLFWAVLYNIIALPLASGLFIPIWGERFSMNPMVAGLAMALSSVSVVMNSLLLRMQFR